MTDLQYFLDYVTQIQYLESDWYYQENGYKVALPEGLNKYLHKDTEYSYLQNTSAFDYYKGEGYWHDITYMVKETWLVQLQTILTQTMTLNIRGSVPAHPIGEESRDTPKASSYLSCLLHLLISFGERTVPPLSHYQHHLHSSHLEKWMSIPSEPLADFSNFLQFQFKCFLHTLLHFSKQEWPNDIVKCRGVKRQRWVNSNKKQRDKLIWPFVKFKPK